jgi:hypothetical protein
MSAASQQLLSHPLLDAMAAAHWSPSQSYPVELPSVTPDSAAAWGTLIYILQHVLYIFQYLLTLFGPDAPFLGLQTEHLQWLLDTAPRDGRRDGRAWLWRRLAATTTLFAAAMHPFVQGWLRARGAPSEMPAKDPAAERAYLDLEAPAEGVARALIAMRRLLDRLVWNQAEDRLLRPEAADEVLAKMEWLEETEEGRRVARRVWKDALGRLEAGVAPGPMFGLSKACQRSDFSPSDETQG